MDGFSILLMLVVLLVLIGVLVYVIRDYYLHKDENAADFDATKRDLATEKTDRLGNVRYIVDRVNTINEDIYTTFTQTAAATTSNMDALSATQKNTLLGLDAFVRFTSNEPVLAAPGAAATAPLPAPSLNLLNLPGVPTANAELIRHTSFLGGITARDLKPDGNLAARFCAPPATAGAAPRCVEFPSADGNTYLTPLVDGKAIQLDGPTAVAGTLSLYTSLADSAAATATAPTLSALPDKMLSVQASRTAFGGENYAPGATVEIRAGPTPAPAFRVSTANNASEALLVDANGDVTVSKLVLKRPGAPAGVALSISPDDAQKLILNGSLQVTGALHYDPAISTKPPTELATAPLTEPATPPPTTPEVAITA